MSSFSMRIGLAAGAALLATIFALPASPASASASTCNPNPLDDVHECTTVIGSGLKITSISGHLHSDLNGTPYDAIHIEIYGPNGLIHNCAQYDLPNVIDGPVCKWTNPNPTVNMRAGDYCTAAWNHRASGYDLLSVECIGVHS